MLSAVRKWRGLTSVSLIAVVTLSACSDAGLVEPINRPVERGDGASAAPAVIAGDVTQDLECGTPENPCTDKGIANDGSCQTSVGLEDRYINETAGCDGPSEPPPSGGTNPGWPDDGGGSGDGAGGGTGGDDESGPLAIAACVIGAVGAYYSVEALAGEVASFINSYKALQGVERQLQMGPLTDEMRYILQEQARTLEGELDASVGQMANMLGVSLATIFGAVVGCLLAAGPV